MERLTQCQFDSALSAAVKGFYRHSPGDANCELMTLLVRVSAARSPLRHLGDPEHPFHFKWHESGKFDRHQDSARLPELRQLDDSELIDCRRHRGKPRSGLAAVGPQAAS